MRTRSRTTLMAAVGAAALALAGCSSGSSASASAGQDGDQNTKVELTYWHAYSADSPEVNQLNTVVIPAFEKAHPTITVKAVAFPYDQLHQKLLTSTAGGTLPCLVRSDIIWVPELAKLGAIVNMEDQLSDFQTIAAKTYPGALATNLYNGKHFGLPLDTNTRVLMYNEATLAKAGVAQPPATFDDVRALAAKLKGTGSVAFADNGTSGWNLFPWIWSAGGDVTDPDQTTATGYLNSPKSVAGVQLLVDLHKEGQLPDIILGGKGGVETSVGLPSGKYASILDGPWMYPIFQKQNPEFDLKTAPMPDGGGGSISVVGGEDLVMTSSCPDKPQAAEFARYMLGEDAQVAMAKVGQMPVLKDLGSTLTDIQPYYAAFAEQLQTAKPRLPNPQYPKIETIISTEVQKALKGEQTVQQALDSAAAQIDPLLAA
jgi:multiple sugar transport system substrate-binding protein